MANNTSDKNQKMTGLGATLKSSVNPPTIPSAERGNNIIGPSTYTPVLPKSGQSAAQWSKRSAIRKWEFFQGMYETPGPQHYEIEPNKQAVVYKDNRGKFLAEERFKELGQHSIGSTPNNVGPGRYNINVSPQDKQYPTSAGFCTSADRDYVQQLIRQKIIQKDNPGPGCYSIKSKLGRGHTILSEKILEKSNKLKGLGVSFKPSASVDPASIPSPPRAKNPIGPAYYTPLLQIISSTGAQWSKRSGSRKLDENPQFKLNYATPGPQHYEIEPTTQASYSGFYEDSIGKFLEEPRFKECQNNKRRHPNAGTETPAPVAYALSRFADDACKVESSAFKSGTKRFQQKETGVPAAGNYTVYSEIVRNKSFRIYREKAPFESGAARFDAKKFQNYQHLGPATYNTNSQSLAHQSIREANVKKTVKGGFGSTEANQKRLIQSSGDIHYPGPCNYNLTTTKMSPHKSEKSFSMFGTSCFSSMSNRMRKSGNDRPAPWDYNITQYTIASKIDRPNKVRRFKRAFNSSISRKANEEAHKHNTDETPGPAAYEILKNHFIEPKVQDKSNRYSGTKDGVPKKNYGWHK